MSQSGASAATEAARQQYIHIGGTKYRIPSYYFDGCKEITWDTLCEAMIKKIADEVKCVNKVDFTFGVESSYAVQAKKTRSSNPWEFVHEKHDVMVFKKKLKDSRLSFIGRGIIDKPLREVAEFIKNVENNLSWDNFLTEAKYIKTISETPTSAAYVGYQRFENKKCMLTTKRDMLYLASCLYQDDRYIQGGMSIDNTEHPCPPGVKRVELAMGSGWVMDKLNGNEERTLVTYVGNVDLKGIPTFVMNLVLKRHPLAVHYVRRQMINPKFPPQSQTRSRCTSNTSNASSEDFDDSHIFQSMELPDDFIPSSYDSDGSNERSRSRSYEQSMPIEHFTKLC